MNTTEFMRLIGQRVREKRMVLELSQERLAAAAGLHRTQINLIEQNRRKIRIETLLRLAIALCCEPADLLPRLARKRKVMFSNVRSHPDTTKLDELFPDVQAYQGLATKHGIGDIFQDNGGKLLQTLMILNLQGLASREGNDARDDMGNEFELKTVNVLLTSSFSTHHHLNRVILAKYRNVYAWYFSIYEGIELVEIFRMTPVELEQPFFTPWEAKWGTMNQGRTNGFRDINNPKISVKYVQEHGELVYRVRHVTPKEKKSRGQAKRVEEGDMS